MYKGEAVTGEEVSAVVNKLFCAVTPEVSSLLKIVIIDDVIITSPDVRGPCAPESHVLDRRQSCL